MSARPLLHDAATLSAPLQRLGKYEIVGVLGEGAMGVVYNAIDPHINRRVAVKAIRAPLLGEAAQELLVTQRFRTEARAAGRLSHPNIVSIYEYGEAGDERYIAMEYVSGVSLHELLAHGRRLPLDDVASVMLQLLDALECAHEQGVWHRDIKPANLLITADGRLKVTDFGIARIESSELTLPSSVLGSSGYMAPERYTGGAPDLRVDIFSCGVLLFQLLTGQALYHGTNSEVMYQVLHETPPAPSTLAIDAPPPARFDAVVARAVAKNPEDRYASAAQMRDALREAAGRPIAPTVSTQTMVRPRPNPADAPTEFLARGTPSAPQPPQPPIPPSGANAPSRPQPGALDAKLLAALEALLVEQLGPVARLVVRDAARRSQSAAALVARIAAEALDADERNAFIRRARKLLPAQPAPAPPAAALPVLGCTPMAPGVVEAAQRLLAEQIGPIAGLLVRRACAHALSREEFFTALVDQAGDDIDRKELLAQLWRIA
jgi:eukaryotic-like serine/threonine-protein kinase